MLRSTHFQQSRSLSAEELEAAHDRCPVCGSGRKPQKLFTLQEQPAVYLLHCPDCRGASASQLPTKPALDSYYSNYYAAGHLKYTFSEPGRLVNHILHNIDLPANRKSIRLLDFGGGDGTIGMGIAEALSGGKREVEMVLVDYEEPLPYQGRQVKYCHYHDLEQVSGTFNLIIASAILEHIPHLKPVIEKLLGLAAADSYFYARTPWVAPLARIFPRLDFTFPGHLHDLGAPFWNRVPETFGCSARIVKSQPSIIETTLQSSAARTTAAYLLKLPAHLERKLFPKRKDQLWQLTGGWEVFLKFTNTN